MEYLSTLDAGFLEAEGAGPHVSLAVGALAVFAGPAPEFAPFIAGLGERLAEVPRFKQVLRTHPLRTAPRRRLPILPIALQVRTGIAILSYADELVFGITADYDAASDVDELATGIEHAAARLMKRSSKDARLVSK
jgi:WS/DGAT C-terminal domain